MIQLQNMITKQMNDPTIFKANRWKFGKSAVHGTQAFQEMGCTILPCLVSVDLHKELVIRCLIDGLASCLFSKVFFDETYDTGHERRPLSTSTTDDREPIKYYFHCIVTCHWLNSTTTLSWVPWLVSERSWHLYCDVTMGTSVIKYCNVAELSRATCPANRGQFDMRRQGKRGGKWANLKKNI